ncbi:hypothetical protein MIS46_10300 [Wielerella bovis]|uniref:hypothetical protein n=1 Tax=Wielerella bovis TaxID=2917790 RepID=UPI0020190A96|nr:hypothetical protein [Wielerella bovis]ULJ62332.1 hypothetical protein MIS46_10300 [Wielerella bovis]
MIKVIRQPEKCSLSHKIIFQAALRYTTIFGIATNLSPPLPPTGEGTGFRQPNYFCRVL